MGRQGVENVIPDINSVASHVANLVHLRESPGYDSDSNPTLNPVRRVRPKDPVKMSASVRKSYQRLIRVSG